MASAFGLRQSPGAFQEGVLRKGKMKRFQAHPTSGRNAAEDSRTPKPCGIWIHAPDDTLGLLGIGFFAFLVDPILFLIWVCFLQGRKLFSTLPIDWQALMNFRMGSFGNFSV
jgi:hypothetical protein